MLVTAPCNSPEQTPITFGTSSYSRALHNVLNDEDLGCAHAQQLIWQLFNTIEKGYAAAGDIDTEFLDCTFS